MDILIDLNNTLVGDVLPLLLKDKVNFQSKYKVL